MKDVIETKACYLGRILRTLKPRDESYKVRVTETHVFNWTLDTDYSIGCILNDNVLDGVFIDLSPTQVPEDVISMYSTFENCWCLVASPILPSDLRSLCGTFSGCENLLQPPVIPKKVEVACSSFSRCYSLVKKPEFSEKADTTRALWLTKFDNE